MRSDNTDKRRSRLYLLASSVANDERVDWQSAERAAPEDQLATIRGLRLISRIARATPVERNAEHAQEDEHTLSRQPYEHECWGPLLIEENIGAGSFGEVFRARDPNLDRLVALKLYYRDHTEASKRATDLLSEGRLLARVQHPNVATVHGAENHAGRIGIWMEYILGATLERILQDQITLSVEEAMLIGHDVCRALAALHDAGIIHRDVKASNIMRAENGRIVLMDLGVSRDVDDRDYEKLYGTPLFAAPEVLLAGTSSPLSDLYSVGVLLFLMVSGEYPVAGSTLDEISAGHRAGNRRRLGDLRPDLPERFINIVERALAPDPARRIATAAVFAQELEQALNPDTGPQGAPSDESRKRATRKHLPWALGIALPLAAIVLAVILNLLPGLPWQTDDAESSPRILVTFFENRTGDEALDLIGPMATDWIIQGLSRIQLAQVIPTMTVLESTRLIAAADQEPPETEGFALHAEAVAATMVVSGAYYLEADSLRFLVNIVDTQRNEVLRGPIPATGHRDRPLETIEGLRQKIMTAIAVYLDPRSTLTRDGEPPRFGEIPVYEAYREYVDGLANFGVNYDLALQHFETAAAIDSTFMAPLFWMCGVYTNLGRTDRVETILQQLDRRRDELNRFGRYILDYFKAMLRGDYSESVPSIRSAAEITPRDRTVNFLLAREEFAANYPRRSLETLEMIMPDDSYYSTWFGAVRLWLLDRVYYSLGDYQQELATVDRVIAYHPNLMWSRCSKVRALAALDRFEEIDAVIDECLNIPFRQATPASVMSAAARELRMQGRYDHAREYANRAVGWCREQTDSNKYMIDKAEALRLAERWSEARDVFEHLHAEDPDEIDYLGKLGTLAARLGDEAQARKIQDDLEQVDRPYILGTHLFWCAGISALLGESERSLVFLREAVREGLDGRDHLREEMAFEPLRDYPPFQELIKPRG